MTIIGLSVNRQDDRDHISGYLAMAGFVILESRAWFDHWVATYNRFGVSIENIEERFRQAFPWAFCDPIEKLIADCGSETDLILVPDIMHETEANWIRARGFLWHVDHDGCDFLVKPKDNDLVFTRDSLYQSTESMDEALLACAGLKSTHIN